MAEKDKYDIAMAKMAKMSRQGREQEMRKIDQLCSCPGCPSHNKCAKDANERAFCAKGKSTCIKDRNGCICSSCPVADELGLMHQYYCMEGSEADIRKDLS